MWRQWDKLGHGYGDPGERPWRPELRSGGGEKRDEEAKR